MQIVIRSLGVWAGTFSLIGAYEEPPAMPVGYFFYLTPTKKLFILTLHQLITDVRFRTLFCGCLYNRRKKATFLLCGRKVVNMVYRILYTEYATLFHKTGSNFLLPLITAAFFIFKELTCDSL